MSNIMIRARYQGCSLQGEQTDNYSSIMERSPPAQPVVKPVMVRATLYLCQLVSPSLSPQGTPKAIVTPVPPFLQLSGQTGVGQHPGWALADRGHVCSVLWQPLWGFWGPLHSGVITGEAQMCGIQSQWVWGRHSPASVGSLQRSLMQKEASALMSMGEREAFNNSLLVFPKS